VYEDFGAQELIELISPGRISSHEPLHRSWLVWCVVVDVHSRVLTPTLDDEVDEPLKHLLLLVRRQCPERLVIQDVLGVAERVPEKVVDPTVLGLPIPFEIEKEVEG